MAVLEGKTAKECVFYVLKQATGGRGKAGNVCSEYLEENGGVH